MANFNESFKILLQLEFNKPSNALHKNPTEPMLTFMGIYEKAHPGWIGWDKIHKSLTYNHYDIEKTSVEMYNDESINVLVYKFYKHVFWDALRLDEIKSQIIANEMFLFAVNAGIKVSIRTAQKVLGVAADGILGPVTLNALNNFDEKLFDDNFDKREIEYYESLIKRNPKLQIYARGWRNRAYRV